MAFMLPFVSVAADVYSAEELMNAIYEFNSTEDAELVIVLKADITDAVDFSTCEGKTYYIDGNTFTLADVAIYANGGDVTIDADVEGAGAYSEAVSVYSDSEVETNIEVNGDITGGDTDEEWDGAGVGLVVQGENIEVLVDGDVTGGNATGGNSAGIETEAGNGVYVVLHVKHEGDGRSWENGEIFVKGDIEGGADSNGERAAAIHLDGRYADLPGEADDNYLTEQEQAEYIETYLEELKEWQEEDLAMDILGDSVWYVEKCVEEVVGPENAEEVLMEYLMELWGKACEFIGEDLETLMQEDPNGEVFAESLKALPLEKQMELSKQLLAMANEMIAEMLETTVAEDLGETSIPDITVWGFGTTCENIQAEEVTALLTEMLNKDVEYLIKVADVEGGSVAVETKAKIINAEDELTAKAGETVIVNPTPDEGYKLNKVLVSGTELTPVDGVYSFVVPEDGQVIVSAEFEKIVVEPEEPKEEPKENSKTEENVESVIPKTNDINSFGIYVGLMIISLVCVVVVYKKTKKYNI